MNKRLVILIVLALLAVISLVRGIVTPSKVRRELSRKQSIQKEELKPPERLISTKRHAKRSGYLTWGKSPFIPSPAGGVVGGERRPELVLSGIMWNERNPCAIINGNMVRVGDNISDYEVVKIKPDHVILTDGEVEFELGISALVGEEE